MKKSKYNFIYRLNDGTNIAFNCMTSALAEVDDNFIEILENIGDIDHSALDKEKKELIDNMLAGNYILPDDYDELKFLKFRSYSAKFADDLLKLTIAPTMSCNFDCPYCYETPKNGIMSVGVQQCILDLVKKYAELKKNISITWYGGEPLLAKNVIFKLSEEIIKICEQNHVMYDSFIITNGYLINKEVADKFKNYKIRGAQITVDGPPHIHNARRKLKTSEADTFDVILNNIEILKTNGIGVQLRVNIDKTNFDYIDELLDILEEKNLKEIMINLGHVNSLTDGSCASFAQNCFKRIEYADANMEFKTKLYKRGFLNSLAAYYPGTKSNFCGADSKASFVIDPEGNLYKCWTEIGNIDKSVGNILDSENATIKQQNRAIDYMLWSPFTVERCIQCEVLPICMGGCPYCGVEDELKPSCEIWKYSLEHAVKLMCLQKTGKN